MTLPQWIDNHLDGKPRLAVFLTCLWIDGRRAECRAIFARALKRRLARDRGLRGELPCWGYSDARGPNIRMSDQLDLLNIARTACTLSAAVKDPARCGFAVAALRESVLRTTGPEPAPTVDAMMLSGFVTCCMTGGGSDEEFMESIVVGQYASFLGEEAPFSHTRKCLDIASESGKPVCDVVRGAVDLLFLAIVGRTRSPFAGIAALLTGASEQIQRRLTPRDGGCEDSSTWTRLLDPPIVDVGAVIEITCMFHLLACAFARSQGYRMIERGDFDVNVPGFDGGADLPHHMDAEGIRRAVRAVGPRPARDIPALRHFMEFWRGNPDERCEIERVAELDCNACNEFLLMYAREFA